MAGAILDIVVLSSSPPDGRDAGPQRLSPPSPLSRRVDMPALSPIHQSPLASPKGKALGALRTGSRATPLPAEATQRFATARSVLEQDNDLAHIQEALARRSSIGRPKAAERLPKMPRIEARKPPAGGSEAEFRPKAMARKSRAKLEDGPPKSSKPATPRTSSHFSAPSVATGQATEPRNKQNAAEAGSKPPKPRKPRTTTDAARNTQSVGKKHRTAKPKSNSKITKTTQRNDTSVKSAHFRGDKTGTNVHAASLATAEDMEGTSLYQGRKTAESIWDVPLSPSDSLGAPPKELPLDATNYPLELEEAVRRKRDWTPPANSTGAGVKDILIDSAGKENKVCLSQMSKDRFTDVLSGYAYTHMDVTSDISTSRSTTSEAMSIKKRRRIELVDVPVNQLTSRQSSTEKGKAPKKKARTITDLVTGQYAPKLPVADSTPVTSELFASQTTTTKVALNDTVEVSSAKPMKSSRKRSKSTSQSGEIKPKLKKVPLKGATKPQMVADQLLSPLSAVMRMNKQDVLFGTSSQLALDESPDVVREIQHALRESERDAESETNRLTEAPAVEMWPRLHKIKGKRALWGASSRDDDGQLLDKQRDFHMPEPDRTQDFPLLMDGTCDMPDNPFNCITSSEQPVSILLSSDLPTPPPTIAEDPVGVYDNGPSDETSFVDIDDFAQEPPPSNQNQSSFYDIDDFTPPTRQHSLPTPAQSALLGPPERRCGRPLKPHSAIPSSSCVSPPKVKLDSTSKQQPLSHLVGPLTPRRKGRFAGIEEILDSEDDEAISPIPPRVRKLEDSPPLVLVPSGAAGKDVLVPVFCIPASQLEWINIKATVFAKMTSAIRSLPPTTDPSAPSWHEKILMYDPIVLEDFTAFLNTEIGIRAYKRATQKQIKAWNKERKAQREDKLQADEAKGEVLAVEKELETWMVQKWCEEMSVCCIMREGRGRGGVRKCLY